MAQARRTGRRMQATDVNGRTLVFNSEFRALFESGPHPLRPCPEQPPPRTGGCPYCDHSAVLPDGRGGWSCPVCTARGS